jgi:hypothetical protein
MTEDQSDTQEVVPNRWQVLRDAVAFQFKLLMDGARDVLLSPISIGAAILGLIFKPDNPGIYFNRLMKFGHKTDVWINLFGASNQHPETPVDEGTTLDFARPPKENISSDAYVKKLEDLLIAEYNKGGLIKDLKEGTDTMLEKLRKDP